MSYAKVMFGIIASLLVLLAGEVKVEAAAPPPGQYFYIRSVSSGLYLDLQYFPSYDGNPVAQWGKWSGTSQHWRFFDLGNGYYKIGNRYDGRVLDDPGWSTDNGAKMQVYTSYYLQD